MQTLRLAKIAKGPNDWRRHPQPQAKSVREKAAESEFTFTRQKRGFQAFESCFHPSALIPSGTFLARRPSFASICKAYISLPQRARNTSPREHNWRQTVTDKSASKVCSLHNWETRERQECIPSRMHKTKLETYSFCSPCVFDLTVSQKVPDLERDEKKREQREEQKREKEKTERGREGRIEKRDREEKRGEQRGRERERGREGRKG